MVNEKRLIDANAFQFEPDPIDNIMNGVLFMGRATGKTLLQVKCCLKAMIDNAPTVDAVEVVHGRWVDRIDGYGFCGLPRCSICGSVSFTTSKYCQDCGAKMDGGNEDV
jgi:hypothetical protein